MPKRIKYRNGDPIGLPGGCDGCSPSMMINGVLCHEHGCPEAWRDTEYECKECGHKFYRAMRYKQVCGYCEAQWIEDDEEESE